MASTNTEIPSVIKSCKKCNIALQKHEEVSNSIFCLNAKRSLMNCKRAGISLIREILRIGKEDPRRVIHSFKVGLALAIVSIFYLTEPLFHGFGHNTIWAVLTVVLVLEFSAGATLSKGLNRGLGTLIAGSLAVGVEYIADHAGDKGQPIIIGFSVFILVSGYRVENILHVAYLRLATIAMGCGVCLLICLFIYPIWAGEDLHNLIIGNLQRLAQTLQGSVEEYFEGSRDCGHLIRSSDDPIFNGYQSVLESKLAEESLANFASWEPMHGPFRFGYPWKQYIKIGSILRHSAYTIVALHDCLLSESQAPRSLRAQFKVPCMKISTEAGSILQELAQNIRDMRRNRPLTSMLEKLSRAMQDLQSSMRAQPELFIDTEKWFIVEEIDPEAHNEEIEVDTLMHPPCTELSEVKPRSRDHEDVGQHFRRYLSWNGDQASEHKGLKTALSYRLKEQKQVVGFLEALPLATFASLLMEIAARLEHIIIAVDELGKLANFKKAHAFDEEQQHKSLQVMEDRDQHKVIHDPSSYNLNVE
eukprot:Gb_03302 [translate_table: standard]